MAKKEGDVRTRLHGAALELFRERGYDRTTAAEIAGRAGVTERTFFRYFPDKREVLFDGEALVREALTTSIADTPAGLGPLDTLFRAFQALQPMLEDRRSYAKPCQDIIAATPALHERELMKIAALGASAAWSGNIELAVGNILGGIAIQTVVLVALDAFGMKDKVPLMYKAASLTLVVEGLIVIAVLAVALMATQLPDTLILGRVTPGAALIGLFWVGGV